MKRQTSLVLLGGALVGYLVGHAVSPSGVEAAPAPAPQNQASAAPALPALMPGQPTTAMYWSSDDLRKIVAARAAARRPQGGAYSPVQNNPPAGGGQGPGGGFQTQRFRTHNIGINSRFYWDPVVPANLTGVPSHYDDAEQHEGVSDFYVILGGGGKMVVDGEIENRQYRRAGDLKSLLLPGEFCGQPLKNATTYDVKPGDWLAIPPNAPHWQLPEPGDGMSYLLLKVNVGLYPGSISR
jgi:mannose-6-phosphate isomerase-like protein (cupin superfamily)